MSAYAGPSPIPQSFGLGRRRFLPGVHPPDRRPRRRRDEHWRPQWGDGAPVRPERAEPACQRHQRRRPAVRPRRAGSRSARLFGQACGRNGWHSGTSYVTPEGRVIDTGNGNASHSEGQGWGMMAAQAANDARNLCHDPYTTGPSSNLGRRPVRPAARLALQADRRERRCQDLNNATDGDLFIAAALARAAGALEPAGLRRGGDAHRPAPSWAWSARRARARCCCPVPPDSRRRTASSSIHPTMHSPCSTTWPPLAPSPQWEALRQRRDRDDPAGPLRQVDAAAGLAARGPGRRVRWTSRRAGRRASPGTRSGFRCTCRVGRHRRRAGAWSRSAATGPVRRRRRRPGRT